MIELIYETHSTTEDNEAGIASGWSPGRLSTVGREQARALGERRRDVDVVVHADLARTVETATIAFDGTTIPRLADWRLRECDYGSRTGTPSSELDRVAHADVPYPDGESWRQAVERNLRVLPDLHHRWDGARVLLIGCGAARWALLTHFAGHELEELLAKDVPWQEGWTYSY